MKIIEKNTKRFLNKIRCKNSEKKVPCKLVLYRALYAILCICLAIVVCASCALFEICLLRGQTRAIMHGSSSEKDKIRIYIDQGHNPLPYHNNGAEGNGLYEQDVTFDIGCRLAELLIKDGRFEVCLSRPDENTVLGTDKASSLKERVDGAADFNADYCISLHINAYTQDTANGIEVFSADDNESYSFGSSLLQGMVDDTRLKNRGMKPSSGLYILENAEMPAVLLEMGFISNADDAAVLSEQPELFAQGIYNGIIDYFESIYTLDLSILLWMIGSSTILIIFIMAVLLKMKKQFGLKYYQYPVDNFIEGKEKIYRNIC